MAAGYDPTPPHTTDGIAVSVLWGHVASMLPSMRGVGWLVQLWRLADPASRVDWILGIPGQWVKPAIYSAIIGAITAFVRMMKNTPLIWAMVSGLVVFGLTFFAINQTNQFRDWRTARINLSRLSDIEPCAPRDASQTGRRSPWFSSSHRPLRKAGAVSTATAVAKTDHRRKVHRRHRSRRPTAASRLTPTVTNIPQ
jgi:hypothetical protein